MGIPSTSMPIFIRPETITTSILSPISQDQKDGIVYYYNYSGVLIGMAKTKEKPNISEGLYIFRIEYSDNTFSSGKYLH